VSTLQYRIDHDTAPCLPCQWLAIQWLRPRSVPCGRAPPLDGAARQVSSPCSNALRAHGGTLSPAGSWSTHEPAQPSSPIRTNRPGRYASHVPLPVRACARARSRSHPTHPRGAARCTAHDACCMMHGVCCMLHGACCMMRAVRCMRIVACCILSAACEADRTQCSRRSARGISANAGSMYASGLRKSPKLHTSRTHARMHASTRTRARTQSHARRRTHTEMSSLACTQSTHARTQAHAHAHMHAHPHAHARRPTRAEPRSAGAHAAYAGYGEPVTKSEERSALNWSRWSLYRYAHLR
jgi:hypothetical protein